MGEGKIAQPPEFVAQWFSEWRADVEIVAAGVEMRARVRILGARDVVVTLPREQRRLGRLLAGLTPIAMAELARGLVISVPNADGVETWMLCRGEARCLSTTIEFAPIVRVVKTVELLGLECAPALVQRLGWICRRAPFELNEYELTLAEIAVAENPECFDAIAGHEHREAWA